MFMKRFVVCIAFFLVAEGIQAQTLSLSNPFPGIGRNATENEVRAWDIDVRADFKGLPRGAGSVVMGQKIWESRCESCHGVFGESNEVFTPITGGITLSDIKAGRVKALLEPIQRSTLMKLSTLSTLWDYINRAMPWNAPKSLTTDEVYAVTAYILHLGDILPTDFVLSDKNMNEVQKRLPNRNGTVHYEGLWALRGKPDVYNVACMTSCAATVSILSSLPEFARGAHGNLAEQQRLIGPTRGIDTSQPGDPARRALHAAVNATPSNVANLAIQNNCAACHEVDKKKIGPSYHQIAARYKGDANAESTLRIKVKQGGVGAWGAIPMPAQTLKDDDVAALVKWILQQE